MLINFSNHPSSLWPENQLNAALEYGTLTDIQFPAIDPEASSYDIQNLAKQYAVKLMSLIEEGQEPKNAVHIMGEFTFCFAVVMQLINRNITCLASTTRRTVTLNADGTKVSKFEFVRFREYINYLYRK